MSSNVIVYGLEAEHDTNVYNAFLRGYSANGARYNGNLDIINFSSMNSALNYALTSNYQFIIYSGTGTESLTDTANSFYPYVTCFFPAGSNSHIQIFNDSVTSNNISAIITGCTTGNNQNITGYNVEFLSIDPIQNNASSYSNGYIAGQICYIKDYLNCSIWEARYIARNTASLSGSFTNENGFGSINLQSALNTFLDIPEDLIINLGNIGNISVGRNESAIGITIDTVTNANAYKIYRNDVLIYDGTSTTYSDTVSPTGIFNYKYKAYNRKAETEFSNTAQIVYQAYQQIYYK